MFSEEVFKNTIFTSRQSTNRERLSEIPPLTHYQLKKILELDRRYEQCFPRRLPLKSRKIATPFEVGWELTKDSVVSKKRRMIAPHNGVLIL